MAYDVTGRRRPTKPKKQARIQKRKRDDVDVEKLSQAVTDLDPAAPISKFTDLPLSEPTKAGLNHSKFANLTDIQRRAIPVALLGRDILGAARTGSGKTLAFLIPVLENLYRANCVGADAGLGAMIISPTRELAIQIFDVLCAIGKYGHLFAAGLVIGGKSLKEEQAALARMNIVVCTPGRMLQHLSQTSTFSFAVDSLRMLVLDEADRIMDMGFQRDVDATIEYLPPDRQTLLFSATQTKRVSDLARLSLRDPEYIAVHEAAEAATPASLQQNYVLTRLPQKLDTLWSFLQTAKKSKILVFVSSGKQVRYLYEALRKLQPGIPLLHLHGRQKQAARLAVTSRFSASRAACMFATDIAARGLDFPAVDWVVQMDCPEDADTYIHRVGRTARYQREGRAVLFLDPAEEAGMLSRLSKARVPIERISVRPSKMQNGGIGHQLAALCFHDPELKYLGQKAFASYVRSLHVMKDKEIFDLERYGEGIGKFAEALGLPGAPRIKFTKGDAEEIKRRKNAPRRGMSLSSDESGGSADEGLVDRKKIDAGTVKAKKAPTVRTKYDRMFERQNQDVLAPHYAAMIEQDDSDELSGSKKHGHGDTKGAATTTTPNIADADADDDDDDLFTIKTRYIPPSQPNTINKTTNHFTNPSVPQADSKRRTKALKTRAGAAKLLSSTHPGGLANQSTKLVFDSDSETGEGHAPKVFAEEEGDEAKIGEARRNFLERERTRMQGADVGDRVVERARRRDRKERRKMRERGERGQRGERAEWVEGGPGEVDGYADRKNGGGGDDVESKGEEDDRAFSLPMQETVPFAELADLYDSPHDSARDEPSPGPQAPSPPPPSTRRKEGKPHKRRKRNDDDDNDVNDGTTAVAGADVDDLEAQARALFA